MHSIQVPTVTPALQEMTSMASVPGPAEGALPATSSNLHMEVMAMLEVARLLEILSTTPHVLGLAENPVT
jgi:hypothetical protein